MVDLKLEETLISREEARDLIERNAGTFSLEWYFSSLLVIGAAIAGVSRIASPNPVSLSDHLVFLVLIVFLVLVLILLLIVHLKPVSFDRHGISIGWLWAAARQGRLKRYTAAFQ